MFMLIMVAIQSVISIVYCENIPKASKWYGIQYYHDYPQKDNVPVITGLTYSIEGDTVINDTTFQKILFTSEREQSTYKGAIRQSESGQQVYFVPQGSHNQYLLYDFSVQQGDTVCAYFGFCDISCEEQAIQYPDQKIVPVWNVLSVQTIDERKHIQVQTEGYTIEWIEGIGTQYILWPFGRTCYATSLAAEFHHTLCAADNEGNILYSFNTDDLGIRNNCPDWETLAIENITDECSSTKYILQDGQILILRGEKTYTLTGQVVE